MPSENLASRAALRTHAGMLRARSRVLCSGLAGLAGLALSACIAPPSSTTRLAESAYDLNEAARFGRMDIAMEHVKDTAREDFSRKHARWGKAVRVVDYEVGTITLRKDGDAEVTLLLNWQRPDETSMRSTELWQRWTTIRGTWWMIKEDEHGGDPGLLSGAAPSAIDANAEPGVVPEATATAVAPPPSPRAHYQTRVIYEQ